MSAIQTATAWLEFALKALGALMLAGVAVRYFATGMSPDPLMATLGVGLAGVGHVIGLDRRASQNGSTTTAVPSSQAAPEPSSSPSSESSNTPGS